MSELKPCECGFSHNDPWLDIATASGKVRVRCSACAASTAPYETAAQAIAAWNTRPAAAITREEMARAIWVAGSAIERLLFEPARVNSNLADQQDRCFRDADAILSLLRAKGIEVEG